MDIQERFWSKVDKTETCWLWTGAKLHGYGYFWLDGQNRRAHRIAWALVNGPIPEGLTLDHLCRVRHCVRPDHLEPVSVKTNLLRGETAAAVNSAKTHCAQGHPFDEANTLIRKDGRRHCRACAREQRRRRYATPEGRAADIAANARYVKERMANDPEFRERRRAYWRERGQTRKQG